MAGHSHWAQIKRAKAANDAKRGKAWSKLSRAIIVAARIGGGDPDQNLQLRYAIDAAKAENMPKDTIERAVKKGSGELGAEDYVELAYEGYSAGGAAILVQALTDNRNRTAPEIKKIFERRNGNMGASGSVAWMFTKRGVIDIPKSAAGEEQLTEIALEHGADDVADLGDAFEISCEPTAYAGLRSALDAAEIAPASSEIAMVPSSTVTLTGHDAELTVKLLEDLEDHEDVQHVYGNYEIAADELERITSDA